MDFHISPEVRERFPDFCVGIVVATGVDNRGTAESEVAAAAERLRERLAGSNWEANPSIAVWRRAFEQAGIDPIEYPSAIESLVRRTMSSAPLPAINTAVDLANAVSLTYMLPIGAHDIDHLQGDMVVRHSREGDLFTPRGQSENQPVPSGEIVYADDCEVRTRRWVWRLGERGKVTTASRAIFFPIDGFKGVNEDDVKAAAADLAARLQQRTGARVATFFVDRDQPSVTFPVQPLPEMADIDRLLNRGVVEIIPKEELDRRLRRGDKIRIYIGIDPTSPMLHLGHAVALRKLREFQRLGHKVIFLIGDFTARIGDPTDRSAARVQLTPEEVRQNAQTYIEQANKILDVYSPINPVEVRYNGEWWDTMGARDLIELAALTTVQQMMQREMFQKRLEENRPIGVHEFLYPLLQGYDSVAMDVDAELGGTDQTFNMLVGRTLLKALKGKEKIVVTTPLLEGTDGRKMSKSFGNTIGISDPPYDQYGRVMSLRDDLILRYFELCTDVPDRELQEIARQLREGHVNPMEVKKRLAREIVTLYHGPQAAQEAEQRFQREIQNREVPADVPTVIIPHGGTWSLVDLLVETKLASSRSEARRLIEQGSVQVDGSRVDDPRATVEVGEGTVLRARRRQFARLAVMAS